jgi:hypothetical protein
MTEERIWHAGPLAELFDDTIASDELLKYWSRILRAPRGPSQSKPGQLNSLAAMGRKQDRLARMTFLRFNAARILLTAICIAAIATSNSSHYFFLIRFPAFLHYLPRGSTSNGRKTFEQKTL